MNNKKIMEDNRKYFGQQCQDDKINTAFRNLHKNLIDEIIGFCRAYNISIDEVHLSADGLENSIKHGSWQPCTDSGLTFMKYSEDYKKAFWLMDEEFLKGKTKKDLNILKSSQEPFLFSI